LLRKESDERVSKDVTRVKRIFVGSVDAGALPRWIWICLMEGMELLCVLEEVHCWPTRIPR